MGITLGSLIEMTMVQTILGQTVLNAWQYEVDGSAFLVEPVQIAEAWWNHVKATYRNLMAPPLGDVFQAVRILELNNPVGDYAEYSVPIAQKVGTRATGTLVDPMPPFICSGVRLTVGTRATRPGQKRFGGVYEGDNVSGVMGSALTTLVNAHMTVMVAPMILGAPAATIVLNPIVTRRDNTGAVTAHQPIVGWVTNPNLTSQNTRKIGRGI